MRRQHSRLMQSVGDKTRRVLLGALAHALGKEGLRWR